MRLIDADALKARIDKASNEWLEQGGLNGLDLAQQVIMLAFIETVRNGFCGEIDKAPTAAQTWATCEERLPDMEKTPVEDSLFTEYKSEPVIVQTKRGEIFLAICRKTEYTDNMPKNRIDWYTFGTNGRKMKVMSKVVMWMPKPEPWKGEKK